MPPTAVEPASNDAEAHASEQRALARRLTEIANAANVLHHEVRNPTSGITQALHAVGDQLGAPAQEVLHDFRTRLRRIDDMLSAVAEYARPVVATPTAVPMAEALRSLATPPTLGLDVRLGTPPPVAQVDPVLLRSALEELLRNAADAGASRVTIDARATHGQIAVDVRDDGPGVPAAVRATLFELFQTTKERGRGIGLAMARKALAACGGDLSLKTGNATGAWFRVQLEEHS